MSDGPDPALDAFLALIAEKGFAETSLRDIAQAAGLGLAELYRRYPHKVALIGAFMARTDAAVLAGVGPAADPEETARDRLFDVMMRRYDTLKSHRAAVRSIRSAARRDPLLALAMGPATARSMAAMLEAAGLSSDGFSGAVRRKGLAAIHIAVSRIFEGDESTDLSKTMAALDSRLKSAERWAQRFEKYTFSARGDGLGRASEAAQG